MLDLSREYDAAITGDARRILLKAVVDIIDPDIVFGEVTESDPAQISHPAQIHNKVFTDAGGYVTLERNRWILDGSFHPMPNDPAELTGEVGAVQNALSGDDGAFANGQWVELQFQNVSILQACSVYFPEADFDGVADSFTVEVKQGGTAYFTKSFSGNRERIIKLDGFTVHNPDAIRLTVTRWSLPGRRMRTPEILPGIYEEWDNSIIAEFGIVQQANFACLALPYGTCTLSMDNLDRRFEPRNKVGVFKSIEERQGIEVSIGVAMEDGTPAYKRVGVFYQFSGGWKTGDNGLTMQWSLVDIVGLLAGRQYLPPSPLPTTLDGWIASIVAQLGVNFEGHYVVDPNYAALPLTASVEDVTGKACGEILRMACMATGTFPRAAAATGKLAVEPYWHQGAKMTLDNLDAYPIIRANDDLAALIFTLADGQDTQYIVSGNSTSSSATVQVRNPFIHDAAAALTAARLILSTYGGNQLSATGRGNPASEIGDVDTVWLNESVATTGRRMMQTFSFEDGVLAGCQSTLLQADGFLFEGRDVVTQSGTYTAPAGATKLRLILIGHGTDGAGGTDGSWDEAGQNGADGLGGKVWSQTVEINPEQQFTVEIGAESVFGQYSSANGAIFPYGYTDVASGDSFARTGVESPLPGSGDGGAGGMGGVKGNKHEEAKTVENEDGSISIEYKTVIDNRPGMGTAGKAGASGCVVIYYDKE